MQSLASALTAEYIVLSIYILVLNDRHLLGLESLSLSSYHYYIRTRRFGTL